MRLWNYQLLPYLPRQQLLSQLRECVSIAKDIYETGSPNHILVNRIMDYDLEEFRDYCNLVIHEMVCVRGYKVSEQTINKLEKYIDFNINYITIKEVKEGRELFKDWHTDRYLAQNILNLQEKYDCKGITFDEWDKIYHKFYKYLDY
jgi:uncharacterized protein (TIGR02328 family)